MNKNNQQQRYKINQKQTKSFNNKKIKEAKNQQQKKINCSYRIIIIITSGINDKGISPRQGYISIAVDTKVGDTQPRQIKVYAKMWILREGINPRVFFQFKGLYRI